MPATSVRRRGCRATTPRPKSARERPCERRAHDQRGEHAARETYDDRRSRGVSRTRAVRLRFVAREARSAASRRLLAIRARRRARPSRVRRAVAMTGTVLASRDWSRACATEAVSAPQHPAASSGPTTRQDPQRKRWMDRVRRGAWRAWRARRSETASPSTAARERNFELARESDGRAAPRAASSYFARLSAMAAASRRRTPVRRRRSEGRCDLGDVFDLPGRRPPEAPSASFDDALDFREERFDELAIGLARVRVPGRRGRARNSTARTALHSPVAAHRRTARRPRSRARRAATIPTSRRTRPRERGARGFAREWSELSRSSTGRAKCPVRVCRVCPKPAMDSESAGEGGSRRPRACGD